MRLSEIFNSQHEENNEIIKSSIKRDLIKKQNHLFKLGIESSHSIVMNLKLALERLKKLDN